MEVLPDADPTYLRFKCDHLAHSPESLKRFISDALENRDYPKMKDCLRKQQLSAQQRQYTTDFQVSQFLEVIPDPFSRFEDEKRSAPLDDPYDFHFACAFLRNEFCLVPATLISSVIRRSSTLVEAHRELENIAKSPAEMLLRAKRKRTPLPENFRNIPLMQEVIIFVLKNECKCFACRWRLSNTDRRSWNMCRN